MKQEIKKLENCLKSMKQCLKIPKVENCICFFDAFKVLDLAIKELYRQIEQPDDMGGAKEKIVLLKKEIEEIQKLISKGKKECLDCSPCIAAVVFKAYPHKLNEMYLEGKL